MLFWLLWLAVIVGGYWMVSYLRGLDEETSRRHHYGHRKVAVIGAGAAGMACSYSLCKSEHFEVTVYDVLPQCGGVATSEPVLGMRINDGVQGGAMATYANVLRLHEEHGFRPTRVPLNVSFGVGSWKWTNFDASEKRPPHIRPEIARFARLMKVCHMLEPLFMLIDIGTLLRLLCFSQQFIHHYVLSLTALFFGTGNQTRAVPAAVVARVFCDPEFAIFRLNEDRFVGESADFFAFSDLGNIYQTMRKRMEDSGRVKFRLGRAVKDIVRDADQGHCLVDGVPYDCVVFACDARAALSILGKEASFWERWTLGGVKLYRDVTYTHTDEQYMRDWFGWKGRRGGRGGGGKKKEDDDDDDDPTMYLVRPYDHDATRGELGFVLSNYQPQAKKEGQVVFQTIFLDQEVDEKHWSLPLLDQSKVLLKKWWLQFAHSRQHFLRVVPFVRFIQSPADRRFLFCGSWTMVNTHEAATLSGFAAAYRLGVDYPFEKNGFAFNQFKKYLSLIHGMTYDESQ